MLDSLLNSFSENPLRGRYKMISPLGSGKFGNTFLAQDLDLPGDNRCVVKELKPHNHDPLLQPIIRNLFKKEAEALHTVGKHLQIPQLLASFEEKGKFYLVQELIEGVNLSEEMKGEILWSEKQVISLLQDVLSTLQFVHENNVIHRDINPNNLIRRKKDERLVLIDFGAVKQIKELQVDSQRQTRSLVIIGTDGFIPNEQHGGYARFNSDIYALGMTAIQALTGVLAHLLKKDEKTDEVIWRHEAPHVSNELAAIIEKMVKSHWRDRYQSVSEVLQDLNNLHTPVSTTTHSQTPASTHIPQIHTTSDFLNQGNALYDLQRYEEAIVAYDQAIKFQPDYHIYWSNRGDALTKLLSYEEAIVAYDQAIKFQPDYHRVWNSRGNALYGLQRYEEAIVAYDQAIKFQPDCHMYWSNRGDALTKLLSYEEAIVAYDQAIKFQPDYHRVWNSRGNALYGLQRYEEAIVAYDQAIKFQPDDHEAWNSRGNALYNLQRYEEAIVAYDQAIKFQPDYHIYWSNRGKTLYNLQRHKQALAAYDQAIQIKPDDHYTWRSLGDVLYNLQSYEEAIAAYDQAIQIKLDDHYTWVSRGLALEALQRYQEALIAYEKAIQIQPDYQKAITYRNKLKRREQPKLLSRLLKLFNEL